MSEITVMPAPSEPSTAVVSTGRLRTGYALALVGCVTGGIFGYMFKQVSSDFGSQFPWSVQDLNGFVESFFRRIPLPYWVAGYFGLALIFWGCFLIVQAKQLHPGWVFAGLLSFVGVLVLAKLPNGSKPRTTREAVDEILILFSRFKGLFVFAFAVSVLICAAWAYLLPTRGDS